MFKLLIAMGTTVEVLFDREDKTYKAGETIFGRVLVESDEEKNLRLIKAMRVRCKGVSTTDLKISMTCDEVGTSLSAVNYLDEDAKVLTHKLEKSKCKKGSVEMIRFEYPFQFTLPKDLPSSFKTPYGRMEYSFKVSVPSGVAVSYFEGKGPFNVLGTLDLNKQKGLNEPVELRLDSKVKTLLNEGTISFCIHLPQKGYAIGEKIFLHQEIINGTKQPVKASISLVQKVSYDFGHVIHLDKENKMKVFGKDVAANVTDICDEEIFEIPSVPVTSTIDLKVEKKKIKIEYFLKYEVVAKPSWLKKFKGYIPIVIGSIPLRKNIESIESISTLSISSQ